MSRSTFVIVICLALPTAALAQLIYPLQQERYVQASVALTYDDPNQPSLHFASAADFDTWQADVCMESVSGRTATASQYFDVTGTAIDAFGAADIHVAPNSPYGPDFSDAQNYSRLRFAVPAPTTFDLVGYISVETSADGVPHPWNMELVLTVQLNRIAGAVVYQDAVTISMSESSWQSDLIQDAPVLGAGELAPGVYELTVSASLHGQTDSDWGPVFRGEASYVVSAEFAPAPVEHPAEADLDGDGDVDIGDFARFQRAFSGPLLGN